MMLENGSCAKFVHDCAWGMRVFRYFRFQVSKSVNSVNQPNTIKSMIPQRWLAVVPPSVRDVWAERIVEKFKASYPELYADMGEWRAVPEDERVALENKVLSAADTVHREVREERNASH